MYQVSSYFAEQIARKNLALRRTLTIGGSDYSAYVLKWPTISKKWDDLRPQTVTINLANEGSTFNFFSVDPTKMRNTVLITAGFKNLLTYSQEFDNAAWSKSAVTISAEWGTPAPDGTYTADRIVETAVTYYHSVSASHTYEAGTYTFSCFCATASRSWVNLQYNGGISAWFNIVTGVVGTVIGCTATISAAPNAFYRCAITFTVSAGGGNAFLSIAESDGVIDYYLGDITTGILAWGIQLEKENHATEYMPTGATASENITVFGGTIDAIRYDNAQCSLSLIDKFRRLTDRKIGDSTSATNYPPSGSSDYLIHDMAWYAMTSHGGLSATVTSANPDIHWPSFNSWTSLFSVDNVRCRASFTGQQPMEVLRKLANLTQSAIYIENNKLNFVRFLLTNTATLTLGDAELIDASATLDDRELINKQWVSAGYNVTSRSFAYTVFDQSSASQASYGLREALNAESVVWLVDSVSALNLAQRTIFTSNIVRNKYSLKAPLQGMLHTVGDAVLFSDSHLEVSDTFRIMGESLDLDSGIKTFAIDQSQYAGAFILDISSLDGTDVLT